MLLSNEIVHKALKRAFSLIMAKLNVVKVFDTINWEYLFIILEYYDFGPKFVQFIRAITTSACSKIQLNGKTTLSIPIQRSVHQGCPLSPLLFLIAMEPLSQMMDKAVSLGNIQSFQWPEMGISQTLALYADDVNLTLHASLTNVQAAMDTFNTFGEASGLCCKWEGTKIALISKDPLPRNSSNLDGLGSLAPPHLNS